MMWSNFFLQEEERRRRRRRGSGGGLRGARWKRGPGLGPARRGPLQLALLLAAVGTTLAVLAVGTEFWVELSPPRPNGSSVCQAAHLGLWKVCAKRLWLQDVPPGRPTCGPAQLPGEANCSYFKFFTTGENAHIFQRTTKKELNLAAAVLAVLGLGVMTLGCLCVIMVLSKGDEFLLKPAAVCFSLAGVLLLVSLEVFRHAVRGLLEGATPTAAPALEYEYSWSVACALAAGTVLLLGGGCFLLLALPPRPWKAPCLQRGDGDT
ncbi:LOW QUALITY PROTEIN: voltage-dependent calcium channel gamma-6 subunit [Tachyglossus aculeatus]|uniref:LOW QUALITY PROTEIN: voltage-dependent calcium channel gamma-6 subunit n=1 Tax=Tachyglossus aculeatus TaxID=9261 RepID=UPI0018F65345|nr:LOW QUALITY PROTEIN: voltage-dependent calcium channel gamma-6 subunit [Tachyglossus aculeatus]